MEILRVFNNNVVLARDPGGQDVVLTGRGLGFQARPGDIVDQSQVARVFVPSDGRDPDTMGALIADIPPEHITLADEALSLVRDELPKDSYASVLVALADHLSFAIKRQRQGIAMEFPLRAEVSHLYARELGLAQRMIDHVNSRLADPVPADEAIAVALHLVNAGFLTGDLSFTYRMTGILRQVFEVIGSFFGQPFDTDTVSAARFITHLRYFFVRLQNDRQLAEGQLVLHKAIREAYPQAYQCALRIQAVLELRLGQPISTDEVTYLTMHVARLAADREAASA